MDLAWCGTTGWAFLMDNGKWKMESGKWKIVLNFSFLKVFYIERILFENCRVQFFAPYK